MRSAGTIARWQLVVVIVVLHPAARLAYGGSGPPGDGAERRPGAAQADGAAASPRAMAVGGRVGIGATARCGEVPSRKGAEMRSVTGGRRNRGIPLAFMPPAAVGIAIPRCAFAYGGVDARARTQARRGRPHGRVCIFLFVFGLGVRLGRFQRRRPKAARSPSRWRIG